LNDPISEVPWIMHNSISATGKCFRYDEILLSKIPKEETHYFSLLKPDYSFIII